MKKSIGSLPLIFPAPALIVTAYDEQGKPSSATAAWAGVVASEPVCVQVSLRKIRHTHDAILKSQAFVLNVPSEDQAKEADYIGIYSSKNKDKLSDCGFTVTPAETVHAPIVDQCPISLICKVINVVEVGSHVMFIGQVVDCKVAEECLDEKNNVDPEKVRPLVYMSQPGLSAYYKLGDHIGRAFSIGKNLD